MKITAQNAAAMRKKAAAETPLILHKLSEYHHQWSSWNPDLKAMVQQEIIIEKWDKCTTAPRAGGKVEVTTSDRRVEWQLEQLHRQQPEKCSQARKTTGIAIYEIDVDTWETWLAEHTERKTNDKSQD